MLLQSVGFGAAIIISIGMVMPMVSNCFANGPVLYRLCSGNSCCHWSSVAFGLLNFFRRSVALGELIYIANGPVLT